MMADTTVCIAASYEAKAFGVKTGTMVGEAKRMCPDLVLEGTPRNLHRLSPPDCGSCRKLRAGDCRLSIDEMACRLMGRERHCLGPSTGQASQAAIREKVGQCLRSSVGLATNRYLAKVASDMEKPDGLVALPLDILPEALRQLTLRDLPGIGARTEKRLNEKGIRTMENCSRSTASTPASCGDRCGASDCGTGCAARTSTWRRPST